MLSMKNIGCSYKHVIGESDLMWRAMKRVKEGFPEEVTMS